MLIESIYMRILLHGYNTCFQNESGGVQNRMRKIYSLLLSNNIETTFFNPYDSKIKDFDVLHLFMLKAETLPLIRLAKQRGVKIVLSSIVNTINKFKIKTYNKFLNKLPIPTTYKLEYEAIHLVDCIIVESLQESVFLQQCYDVDSSKIYVIPNGVDESTYSGREIYTIVNKPKFLLQIGRFDENKNQLSVIKAIQKTDVEVVFIGGSDSTASEYYTKCQMAAKGFHNIHFLGWRDSNDPLFKSALAWADTLILPSYYETFGLVLLEAGVNGAKLVVSNTLPILDYKSFQGIPSFNPSNINDIYDKIMYTMSLEKDESVKERIISEFSWDTVIKQHINLYSDLLK